MVRYRGGASNQHTTYIANVNRARSGQRITSLGKFGEWFTIFSHHSHKSHNNTMADSEKAPEQQQEEQQQQEQTPIVPKETVGEFSAVNVVSARFHSLPPRRLPSCQVKNAGQPFCVPRKYRKVLRWFSQIFQIEDPVCHFSFRTIPCPCSHSQ